MIKIKKILTACLVIALIFSLAACGDDSKEKESSKAIGNTAKATADSTPEAEKETETGTPDNAETPTATEGQEDKDADSTTEPTDVSTIVPTMNPTKAPTTMPTKTPANVETKAPTAKPTVAPTKAPTAEPVSTVKPTKAPVATKSPTTALPTEDPSVDYSEWGKHGFEDLLPIPLPFSDEEADWRSKKETQTFFKVTNFKMIYFENPDDFVSAIKEYAESYESLGYTIISEQYIFTVYSLEIGLFSFTCSANGYVNIDITLA